MQPEFVYRRHCQIGDALSGLQMHRASRSILDAVPDKADTMHWSCLSTLLASS
jgi:hypothetical protein